MAPGDEISGVQIGELLPVGIQTPGEGGGAENFLGKRLKGSVQPRHRRARVGSQCMLIRVNRAPVMTLWAVVVAEHMGFDEEEAPTMGRVVAGLNAYSKGKALGIYTPHPKTVKEERKRLEGEAILHVDLLHRAVPVVRTPTALRPIRVGDLAVRGGLNCQQVQAGAPPVGCGVPHTPSSTSP